MVSRSQNLIVMKEFTQQSIGIDISKETFSACVCQRNLSNDDVLSQVREFKNGKTGFNQLVKWTRKLTQSGTPVVFVMEATGNYYENLAYHLYAIKLQVCVLLPNKVTHFAKSLNIKTKTDAIDAQVIARLGVERKLRFWQPPPPIFKCLKELTRQHSELVREKTAFSNRLHSVKSGYEPQPFIIKSNKSMIKALAKQIENCEGEIEKLIQSEVWLWHKVKNVMTIKGVGFMTVAIILAETQGFEHVQNIRQLTSFAGLDVIRRESGTTVMGKTRISKKGNTRIRAALYFPALVAIQHNEDLRNKYHRIKEGKPSKMVGVTALQRRLLILIYTLWRKNEVYIDDYEQNLVTKKQNQVNDKTNPIKSKAGRGLTNLPAQDDLQPKRLEISLV